MTREEVFDEIYQAIVTKLAITGNNPYSASVLSYFPSYKFDEFPVIVLSQIDYRLDREALNKEEKKHSITIEAQVFSINKPTVNRRTIANQIANIVEGVIQNDFGLGLDSSNVIPNIDEDVYRIVLRFNGIIDDDSKIIYRE
jgi:hypothetical protein